MLTSRAPVLGALMALLAAALLLCPAPGGAADDDKTPDSITPVAASIEKLENVDIKIGDQKFRTTLTYSRRGTILFALPA